MNNKNCFDYKGDHKVNCKPCLLKYSNNNFNNIITSLIKIKTQKREF